MAFNQGLSVVSDGFYNQYDIALGFEQTDKNEQFGNFNVNWNALPREKFVVYDEFDGRSSNDPGSQYIGLYINRTHGPGFEKDRVWEQKAISIPQRDTVAFRNERRMGIDLTKLFRTDSIGRGQIS